MNCLDCFEYAGIPLRGRSLSHASVTVKSATTRDLKAMADCEETAKLFAERLANREHCVVATADNRIVGYEWYCDAPFHAEERYSYKLQIPPDTLYAYDAFVQPEYRRLGVWTLFHVVYLRYLMLRLRKSRIIAMVDHDNKASIEAHSKFGYRIYAKVFVLKIFGKSFCVTRPAKTGKTADRPIEPRDTSEVVEIGSGALPSYQAQGALK